MKTCRPLLFFSFLLLASCADFSGGAIDSAFASAVTRNNVTGVMRTCTPRNAAMPIRGIPPMAYAAGHGNEGMIDVLYNNGASIHVRNPRGQSLAYLAAANGHRSTAGKLVKLGSGTSADVAEGTRQYDQRRQQFLAASRSKSSQSQRSKSTNSTGVTGNQLRERFMKDFFWNIGPPNQWYQQDVPRY
ncbi:MAG: ankyrin repeat domain-containing protein [Prosthecobacter sp.]|jgi:hypothetical protein|uniref:ankyrin repeat domain-containing protein n=1 Tax=Prosthecobacter sp. TaxID=1965333 RepID=UPI0019FDA6A9|nr:ankyrin repeat domain-containing protein [Prosthecobacter sp.]MBE2283608.1 ankyrin repeat domain-containing protein [Prosthecobacter sp.]